MCNLSGLKVETTGLDRCKAVELRLQTLLPLLISKFQNEFPLCSSHWRDGETIAAHDHRHVGQCFMLFECLQSNYPVEFTHQFHIDHVPTRRSGGAFGVKVLIGGFKRRRIRIRRGNNLNYPGDPRLRAAGVIKEGVIALLHDIPDHIAHLVVAYTVPMLGLLFTLGQVIDAERIGLGFH